MFHAYTDVLLQLGGEHFAEVQYFFQYDLNDTVRTFAMVSKFSDADPTITRETHGAVLACMYRGDTSREIIDVHEIKAVVAMVPMPKTQEEAARDQSGNLYGHRYFVVEKPGLAVAFLSGVEEACVGDEGEDEDEEMGTA